MSIIWRTVIEPPFITEKRRQEKIEIEIKQRWKKIKAKAKKKDTNGFADGGVVTLLRMKSPEHTLKPPATMTIPVAIIAVETNHEQHKRSFTKTNQTRYGGIHDNA